MPTNMEMRNRNNIKEPVQLKDFAKNTELEFLDVGEMSANSLIYDVTTGSQQTENTTTGTNITGIVNAGASGGNSVDISVRKKQKEGNLIMPVPVQNEVTSSVLPPSSPRTEATADKFSPTNVSNNNTTRNPNNMVSNLTGSVVNDIVNLDAIIGQTSAINNLTNEVKAQNAALEIFKTDAGSEIQDLRNALMAVITVLAIPQRDDIKSGFDVENNNILK